MIQTERSNSSNAKETERSFSPFPKPSAPATLSDDELLAKLLALNLERAGEEKS